MTNRSRPPIVYMALSLLCWFLGYWYLPHQKQIIDFIKGLWWGDTAYTDRRGFSRDLLATLAHIMQCWRDNHGPGCLLYLKSDEFTFVL